MEQHKAGDIVLVDQGCFTASPERGKGYVRCEVLCDTEGQQTYIVPLPPGYSGRSPMYVANRDIKKEQE